jgi:hypothetical protein
MKKQLLTLAVMSAAAAAWAQAPATAPKAGSQATANGSAQSRLTVEVVSTDPASKTITVRSGDAQSPGSQPKVLNVSPQAIAALKGLRPGDTISLTCESKGRHPSQGEGTMGDDRGFATDCGKVTSISKE